MIPAFAEADSAKTAPATANLIFLFIYFSYLLKTSPIA
jgi:hypothetical protein